METCRICLLSATTCMCRVAANDNCLFDVGFIRIPPDDRLARGSAVHRLAVAYRAKELSRRSVLDHLTNVFVSYAGVVVDSKGSRIDVAEIDVDDIFRTDADPSERWISDFLRAGVARPKRNAQDRVLPRLRVLWLGLAVSHRVQAEIVIR